MFLYCRESHQGGGVFVYVNNLLCAIEFIDAYKVAEVESIWLDMKMGSGSRNMLRIGTFYRGGNLLTG